MISKIEIGAVKDYLETNNESELKIARSFLEDIVLELEEIQQYRSIGTVSDCKEAVEMRKVKKLANKEELRNFNGNIYSFRGNCPTCGEKRIVSFDTEYCSKCGQAISWQDDN